jgi:asparagine synthase (glutamine-hydrolysing)
VYPVEIESVLFADYLKKVDIASSAHGLEVRTPMLDIEVFKVSRRLPIRDKVGLVTQKAALRRIVERRISTSVGMKAKRGFGIPFDRWSAGPVRDWLSDLLLAKDARWRSWIREEIVSSLLHHLDGKGGLPNPISRYQVYQRTFMITSLEVWLRGLETASEIRGTSVGKGIDQLPLASIEP